VVEGVVQGVGFRHFVLLAANRLGLAGWVRNRHDGRVEVLASGPEAVLEELERALRQGPRMARVTKVDKTVVSDEPQITKPFHISDLRD
jgi:acylphosphatase